MIALLIEYQKLSAMMLKVAFDKFINDKKEILIAHIPEEAREFLRNNNVNIANLL
jgi:hypothetical protein